VAVASDGKSHDDGDFYYHVTWIGYLTGPPTSVRPHIEPSPFNLYHKTLPVSELHNNQLQTPIFTSSTTSEAENSFSSSSARSHGFQLHLKQWLSIGDRSRSMQDVGSVQARDGEVRVANVRLCEQVQRGRFDVGVGQE
jgi:hypothetical protein